MAVITQEIKVEVARKNLFQALVSKQSDYNSRFLKVTLCDSGVPITIDPASTVTINANRPDGMCKRFEGVSNDDDTVTVPLAAWMLELSGMVYCDISVTKPDHSKLTSTSFSIDVEPAAASDEAISENEEYDVLVQLVEQTEKAVELAENASAEAAEWAKESQKAAQSTQDLFESKQLYPDAFTIWNWDGPIQSPIIGEELYPNVMEPEATYRVAVSPGKSYRFTPTPEGNYYCYFAVGDANGICLDYTKDSVSEYTVKESYDGRIPTHIYYGVKNIREVNADTVSFLEVGLIEGLAQRVAALEAICYS